jgi:hypothetical protein
MCNLWKVYLCLALAAVIGCAGPEGTGKGTTDLNARLEGAGQKAREEAKKVGEEAKQVGEETKEKAREEAKKIGEGAKQLGEETKEKAGEAAKKVGEFTAELKDKYLGEMKDKLGGCDKQIAELKEKLGGLSGDAKTQQAAKIAGLEEQRKKTGEVFDKLKDGTKDNWAELTTEFGSMMEKLTKAIKDADEQANKR